jgi:molybdopterin-synthase adenylyltransferase
MFDRQVRAFGEAGQHALRQLRIAIVGLGGTGSIAAQQLAHLGVRDFLLIDPDVLDVTNLNRVAGANPDDVGKSKVQIAERHICAVATDASVRTIQDDVMRSAVARQLSNADLIFSCTDSHGSRFVIQQVSYQFLVPCVDLGVTIVALGGHITDVWGRVQLLAPGLPCLTCQGLLDPKEVRRDMMTPFERKADPYIQGEREPAPAVMSLNGTVSSLAVTMLLAIVAGVPSSARHLLYNGLTSALRTVAGVPQPNCFICSKNGAFAHGEARPLLARQD